MRKIVFIGLLLLMVIVPVQAGHGEYHLRVPDAEEYLRLIPQVADRGGRNMYRTLRVELEQYGDLGIYSFDALYGAYQTLDPVSFMDGPDHFHQWPEWIIFAWLRDNNVTLSGSEEISFRDFVIDIIPIDFNGDEQTEWIFDIRSELYNAFWAIAEDATQQSGYRRVETPFLAYSPNCPIQAGCGGGGAIVDIKDVNADGLPEWIISSGGCGWGMCAVSLRMLAWRDDTLTELTDDTFSDAPHWEMGAGGGGAPIVPPEGTWTFQNIDDDAALELIQTGVIDGSMDCSFRSTRVFEWDADADKYIGVEEVIDYEDSAGCALRLAHLALKESDYTTAIQEYERALRLFPVNTNPEIEQYARLRLASAYALNNQEAESLALLEELIGDAPATTLINDMIKNTHTAYIDSHNPVAFCTALYEVVADYEVWSNSETGILRFGQINDYGVSWNYGGGDFSPDTSGCNITGLLERQAEMLRTDRNPLNQLRDMGWQVTHSFYDDLNNDDLDDWLIWAVPFKTQALVLLSSHVGYEVSVMYFAPPDGETILRAQQLPSRDEKFIIRLSGGIDSYCFNPQQAQVMTLYQLSGTRQSPLTTMGSYTICSDESLDVIFTDEETFISWELPSDSGCNLGLRTQATFTWDEVEQQFIQNTPTPCIREESSHRQELELFSCGTIREDFCGFYLEGQEALDAIDSVLAHPPEFADENFLQAVHYSRGLALESLNRLDEALNEYVAIYEAAPASAWGMLAALHLEIEA